MACVLGLTFNSKARVKVMSTGYDNCLVIVKNIEHPWVEVEVGKARGYSQRIKIHISCLKEV